jgi:hypothetical protein
MHRARTHAHSTHTHDTGRQEASERRARRACGCVSVDASYICSILAESPRARAQRQAQQRRSYTRAMRSHIPISSHLPIIKHIYNVHMIYIYTRDEMSQLSAGRQRCAASVSQLLLLLGSAGRCVYIALSYVCSYIVHISHAHDTVHGLATGGHTAVHGAWHVHGK